jgi:hypothetical protein
LHCSSTGNLAWQMIIHIFNTRIMETYTSSKLKSPGVSLTVVSSFPSCRFEYMGDMSPSTNPHVLKIDRA